MSITLPRSTDAHKGNFGRVLLIGGSRGMAGSIALSAIAALKTGSGLVSAAVPDRCLETVASFHPGIMTIPLADSDSADSDSADGDSAHSSADRGQFSPQAQLPDLSRQDAIGCGPGMRTGEGAVRLVATLLNRTQLPRVLDADAINVLAEQKLLDSPALPQSNLVLTPHPGELARLTGIAASDREPQILAAESLVERLGLTIVVKGGPTVVVGVCPKKNAVVRTVNSTGNPGMATAGSGDVLTGIITSLLGQKMPPLEAACLGVRLHGIAGDLAAKQYSQAGMTCLEILNAIPAAIGQMENE